MDCINRIKSNAYANTPRNIDAFGMGRRLIDVFIAAVRVDLSRIPNDRDAFVGSIHLRILSWSSAKNAPFAKSASKITSPVRFFECG